MAAARLLCREGVAVTAVDAADTPALRQRRSLLDRLGVRVILGPSAQPDLDCEVCVVSPGIPLDSPWVQAVQAAGVPVVGELELGASRCDCPILAVTGTNGKSTLANLWHDILMASGRRVALGGNYGTPVCDLCGESEGLDGIVLEVSSFQLETVSAFRPRVGVLLNLQPDHLDRHGTVEQYYAAKMRLFARMSSGDKAVVPAALADRLAGRFSAVTFGAGPESDYRYEPGRIAGPGGTYSLLDTEFDNPVLGLAAAAACAAAGACGCAAHAIEVALLTFRPLPHRMQRVAERNGVRYVDDSKATNLSALAAGVRMAGSPVRLIAGGLLKEPDLESVKEVLAIHARTVYLVGKAAEAMRTAWGETVPCRACGTMEGAVEAAVADAEAGETVLLSPGCASFDQYRNYAARGEHFVSCVERYAKEA